MDNSYLVGPRGIKQYVETALQVSCTFLSFPLTITELDQDDISTSGEYLGGIDIGIKDGWSLAAYPLTHRVPCFGK